MLFAGNLGLQQGGAPPPDVRTWGSPMFLQQDAGQIGTF